LLSGAQAESQRNGTVESKYDREHVVEQFAIESGPFADNPYPIFERLRREAPIFWHEQLNAYIITRYEDCRRLSEDSERFYNSPDGNPAIPYLMQMAGEGHKRLRKLVNPAFSPRGLAASVEPVLPGIAGELVEQFCGNGKAEIVHDMAEPMATRVISRLLNVSRGDEKWMVKTAYDWLEAEANPSNAALQVNYKKNVSDLRNFFQERIAEERAHPSGNLISDLIAAEADGGSLSSEELLANTMALVVAGIETTTRLISNLVYLLASHPAQLQRLLDDMSLLKSAIEETLRLHSPNQPIMRYAQKEMEICGLSIKPGTRVYGMRGSANRDPDVWRDPDSFDIARFLDKGLPPHLSFGWGPHVCIGSYLARRETTVVVEHLLNRVTNLRLDPAHDVRFTGFRNRGPHELHILFDSR